MKNLNHLLSKNLLKTNKPLIIGLILLSFIGFLVSGYLTAEHYGGGVPPCSVVSGCEVVTTSEYSVIFGIPVALFGTVYFVALLVLLIAYLDSKKDIFLKIAFLINIPGTGAALSLISLQVFVIGALCLYCLVVDTASVLIFIGILKIFWYNKSN